jgi:hypothetical protein
VKTVKTQNRTSLSAEQNVESSEEALNVELQHFLVDIASYGSPNRVRLFFSQSV